MKKIKFVVFTLWSVVISAQFTDYDIVKLKLTIKVWWFRLTLLPVKQVF